MNEQTQIDPSVKPLAGDVVADAALVIKAVKAYKAGGKTALLDLMPEATALIHQEIADVQAALPAIKAGYKTSEFWLSTGVALAIGGLELAGHPLPISADAALTAVALVYTTVRGFAKKPVAAPAA